MAARVRAAGGHRGGKLTARVREIIWTAYYLDDIRSDFSVLHRIEDIEQLPAPRFFAYCHRLQQYPGAMAAVVRRQRARAAAAGPPRQLSLSEWARENQTAVTAAHERLTEGR